MKNTVVISEAAAADISEQYNYICYVRQERENAERWVRGLHEAIDGLENFAGYKRAPESNLHTDIELRQKVFKSHRIIFSVDEEKHEVVIHYVRHGARRPLGDA